MMKITTFTTPVCLAALFACGDYTLPTTPAYGQTAALEEPPSCNGAVDWDPEWLALENDVLHALNDARAQQAVCGDTAYAPAAEVTTQVQLQCAARLHAQDMAQRGFFGHENPDGEAPWDRLKRVGYTYRAMGENIAHGQPDAQSVMHAWMHSPGHCKNNMDARFKEVGVGYYPSVREDGTQTTYWTLVFAAPREH